MLRNIRNRCVVVVGGIASLAIAQAPVLRSLGIGLEDIDYPYPVRFFDLTIEGQAPRMSYMDVEPSRPSNGKTVVLLHGKSFSGDYWAPTIAKLSADGYRVIVRTSSASENPPSPTFAIASIFWHATPKCCSTA
jgi:hypothetical protein